MSFAPVRTAGANRVAEDGQPTSMASRPWSWWSAVTRQSAMRPGQYWPS